MYDCCVGWKKIKKDKEKCVFRFLGLDFVGHSAGALPSCCLVSCCGVYPAIGVVSPATENLIDISRRRCYIHWRISWTRTVLFIELANNLLILRTILHITITMINIFIIIIINITIIFVGKNTINEWNLYTI